eukprot:maker-scaffold_9-snap-gene-2.65-mRNA-1 protein AED:0.02 eAED:0.02 QI:102/1/1/1/1/1/4/136/643
MNIFWKRRFSSKLLFSPSVKSALESNKPVVALESTIITHGMPYPENLRMAQLVEQTIKENGATPATIGISKGSFLIGMSSTQLKTFSESASDSGSSKKPMKISSRELGLPNISIGGTTVSATMSLAHQAGIDVFATGGSGGVHFNAFGSSPTFDVSSDLTQLSKTPVTVVSAGIKSILDIGASLEYLETLGVPTATLNSVMFPSFFTPSSKFKSPMNFSCIAEVADFIYERKQLNFETGMLLAVPNPSVNEETEELINSAIKEGLAEVEKLSIKGKEITPFLLDKIYHITKGESLKSNINLVLNNAKVAAKLAVKLNLKDQISEPNILFPKSSNTMVIGGSTLDTTISGFKNMENNFKKSVSAKFSSDFGGVGRNIVENLARLDQAHCNISNVGFISIVGNDSTGESIEYGLRSSGIKKLFLQRNEEDSSASYLEVTDEDGDMVFAFAGMDINSRLDFSKVQPVLKCEYPRLVLLDANLSPQFYEDLFKWKNIHHPDLRIGFEATSVEKCIKAIPFLKNIWLFSPNESELREVLQKLPDNQTGCTKCLVKRGAEGLDLGYIDLESRIFVSEKKEIPSADATKGMVNTRGCGDAVFSGFVFASTILGLSESSCLKFALTAAEETMKTQSTVADVQSFGKMLSKL